MTTRMNDTEARKRQILEKATALFARKGYHGVGIDEIAQACGVVRGTVLKYFGSKKELYRQVLYDRGNPVGEYLGSVCEDTGIPAAEALEKALELAGKQFEENLRYIGEDMKNEEFLQNFDVLRLPIYREQQKYLEKLIERGNREGAFHVENPRLRAFSIMFAVFGVTESLTGGEEIRREIDEIIRRMLDL